MKIQEIEIKATAYSLELSKDELLDLKDILTLGVEDYLLPQHTYSLHSKLVHLIKGILEED